MTKKAPATVIDKSDTSWHLDRKIPVALIMTFVLTVSGQTFTAIWWASKTDSRIEQLERQGVASAPQGDRLTRVEVNLESIKESLTEIKSRLRPR